MEETEIELMKTQMRRDILKEVRQAMLEKAVVVTCTNCHHRMHVMVIDNLED